MMKELYFSPNNIDEVSNRIYMSAVRYSENRPLVFEKEKAGLLIVDMQDYFLSPDSHSFIPSSPTVMDRIIDFKGICQNQGIPVFFTRHVNTQKNAKMLLSRLERLSADSTWAHQASGLRGSLIRSLEAKEEQSKLENLIAQGYELLEKAAREIPDRENT